MCWLIYQLQYRQSVLLLFHHFVLFQFLPLHLHQLFHRCPLLFEYFEKRLWPWQHLQKYLILLLLLNQIPYRILLQIWVILIAETLKQHTKKVFHTLSINFQKRLLMLLCTWMLLMEDGSDDQITWLHLQDFFQKWMFLTCWEVLQQMLQTINLLENNNAHGLLLLNLIEMNFV